MLAFEDFARQSAHVMQLRSDFAAHAFVHAYLLCGPRGTGKKSVARLCAMAAVCRSAGEAGRPCGVCGRDFTPPANLRWSKVNTCPECLSQGKKSYVMHGRAGEGECAVCGKTFSKDKPFQRRCRECIAEAPKHGVDTHLRKKRAAQAKGEPA